MQKEYNSREHPHKISEPSSVVGVLVVPHVCHKHVEVDEPLDESKYINDGDVLTKDGSQALTQCFVQGLIGNIHFAHQSGYRNDAEHLRYIISELERGFASIESGRVK